MKAKLNCIGGIMVVELALSVVDHELDSRSDQTKYNIIERAKCIYNVCLACMSLHIKK
jgi:hypothetical protein